MKSTDSLQYICHKCFYNICFTENHEQLTDEPSSEGSSDEGGEGEVSQGKEKSESINISKFDSFSFFFFFFFCYLKLKTLKLKNS